MFNFEKVRLDQRRSLHPTLYSNSVSEVVLRIFFWIFLDLGQSSFSFRLLGTTCSSSLWCKLGSSCWFRLTLMSAWVFTRLWTSECLVRVECFYLSCVRSLWEGLRGCALRWLASCRDFTMQHLEVLGPPCPLSLLSLHCLAGVGPLWENKQRPLDPFFIPT